MTVIQRQHLDFRIGQPPIKQTVNQAEKMTSKFARCYYTRSAAPSCRSKMPLKYDVSTFPRTRSGRIVIPRLEFWCGERVIRLDTGEIFISTGLSKGLPESCLSKRKNKRARHSTAIKSKLNGSTLASAQLVIQKQSGLTATFDPILSITRVECGAKIPQKNPFVDSERKSGKDASKVPFTSDTSKRSLDGTCDGITIKKSKVWQSCPPFPRCPLTSNKFPVGIAVQAMNSSNETLSRKSPVAWHSSNSLSVEKVIDLKMLEAASLDTHVNADHKTASSFGTAPVCIGKDTRCAPKYANAVSDLNRSKQRSATEDLQENVYKIQRVTFSGPEADNSEIPKSARNKEKDSSGPEVKNSVLRTSTRTKNNKNMIVEAEVYYSKVRKSVRLKSQQNKISYQEEESSAVSSPETDYSAMRKKYKVKKLKSDNSTVPICKISKGEERRLGEPEAVKLVVRTSARKNNKETRDSEPADNLLSPVSTRSKDQPNRLNDPESALLEFQKSARRKGKGIDELEADKLLMSKSGRKKEKQQEVIESDVRLISPLSSETSLNQKTAWKRVNLSAELFSSDGEPNVTNSKAKLSQQTCVMGDAVAEKLSNVNKGSKRIVQGKATILHISESSLANAKVDACDREPHLPGSRNPASAHRTPTSKTEKALRNSRCQQVSAKKSALPKKYLTGRKRDCPLRSKPAETEETSGRNNAVTARPGTLKFRQQIRNYLVNQNKDDDDDDDFLDTTPFRVNSVSVQIGKLLSKKGAEDDSEDLENVATPKSMVPAIVPVSAKKTPDLVGNLTPSVSQPLKRKEIEVFLHYRSKKSKKRRNSRAHASNSTEQKVQALKKTVPSFSSNVAEEIKDLFIVPLSESDEDERYYFFSDEEQ